MRRTMNSASTRRPRLELPDDVAQESDFWSFLGTVAIPTLGVALLAFAIGYAARIGLQHEPAFVLLPSLGEGLVVDVPHERLVAVRQGSRSLGPTVADAVPADDSPVEPFADGRPLAVPGDVPPPVTVARDEPPGRIEPAPLPADRAEPVPLTLGESTPDAGPGEAPRDISALPRPVPSTPGPRAPEPPTPEPSQEAQPAAPPTSPEPALTAPVETQPGPEQTVSPRPARPVEVQPQPPEPSQEAQSAAPPTSPEPALTAPVETQPGPEQTVSPRPARPVEVQPQPLEPSEEAQPAAPPTSPGPTLTAPVEIRPGPEQVVSPQPAPPVAAAPEPPTLERSPEARPAAPPPSPGPALTAPVQTQPGPEEPVSPPPAPRSGPPAAEAPQVALLPPGPAVRLEQLLPPGRGSGHKLLARLAATAGTEGCASRELPFFRVIESNVLPERLAPGGRFSHRLVYALCPADPDSLLTATVTRELRGSAGVVVADRADGFRLRPGTWASDQELEVPPNTSPGRYAVNTTVTFGGRVWTEQTDLLIE
jgi:hypothetical protein